ncbi:unnamed protein product [[Candida] boidinii]|uniref:Unnamed protein product n=1 Tax=Candida boidinii TaxID=5477 RepID=A0ACB5U6R9_CANBO|nr:unnamed protein product [[Candida] boidinii]
MNVDYGIVDNDPIDNDGNDNANIQLEEIPGFAEVKTNVEIEETPKPRKRGRPPKKKRGKSKSNSEETENKIKEIAYNEKVIEEDVISADISTLIIKTEDKNEITEVLVHESEVDHPESENKDLETDNVKPVSDKVQESSSDSLNISNSDAHDITSSHDSSSSFITQGNKKIINAKYIMEIQILDHY